MQSNRFVLHCLIVGLSTFLCFSSFPPTNNHFVDRCKLAFTRTYIEHFFNYPIYTFVINTRGNFSKKLFRLFFRRSNIFQFYSLSCGQIFISLEWKYFQQSFRVSGTFTRREKYDKSSTFNITNATYNETVKFRNFSSKIICFNEFFQTFLEFWWVPLCLKIHGEIMWDFWISSSDL